MRSVTFKDFPVTVVLIVVNVLVFILYNTLGMHDGVFSYFVPINTQNAFDGSIYPYITSMFMHGNIMHLLCNMVSLYYIGCVLETLLGSFKYSFVYLLSGIVGCFAFASMNLAAGYTASAVGASGAVFGLFGAYGAFLLREAISKRPVVFPKGVTATLLPPYIGLMVVNFVNGFNPGIAMEAHIGGFVAGFACGLVFYAMMVSRSTTTRARR